MADLFGQRGLRAIVTEARESMGGRVNRDDLVRAVKLRLTLAEYETWLTKAFRQAVFTAAKSKGTAAGPDAVYAVGDEISPLRLFTVGEFEAKARSLARLSRANRDVVYELSDACLTTHGATFDPDAVLREEGAA
jgi:hypothetical protein